MFASACFRLYSVTPKLRACHQRHCKVASSKLSRAGTSEPPEHSTSLKKKGKQAARKRLDEVCFEQFPEYSQNALRSWIAQGKVIVDNKVIDKAGTPVHETAALQLTAKAEKFVCRAGTKLEAALQHFKIDVRGKRCLDAGISTGGFTDCLLQHGAGFVIGVDVGYGQVAERVRTSQRVKVLERTNARHLTLSQLPDSQPVDFVSLDLAFISALTVLENVQQLMAPSSGLVILIKPQFEAERHQIQEGGVVRDAAVQSQVIKKVTSGAEGLGFRCHGCIPSPVPGAVSGNKEFLSYFTRG